jgi:hypothetical protein
MAKVSFSVFGGTHAADPAKLDGSHTHVSLASGAQPKVP